MTVSRCYPSRIGSERARTAVQFGPQAEPNGKLAAATAPLPRSVVSVASGLACSEAHAPCATSIPALPGLRQDRDGKATACAWAGAPLVASFLNASRRRRNRLHTSSQAHEQVCGTNHSSAGTPSTQGARFLGRAARDRNGPVLAIKLTLSFSTSVGAQPRLSRSGGMKRRRGTDACLCNDGSVLRDSRWDATAPSL